MRWLTLVVLMLWASTASGHGSVHERIAELDRQLAQHPDDAELLMQRGGLYALDEQWKLAVRDYEDALEADPTLPGIEHRLAHAANQNGDAKRALELIDRVLAREPEHADAHLVRARAHLTLGHRAEAIADFSESIRLSDPPSPRSYRELAKAQAEWGPEHVDEALASLRAGMERLGPLVSLVEMAIELEEGRNGHAAALELLALLPPVVRDAPMWRTKRAELLRQAGRLADAELALDDALKALDQLPQARRDTPAMGGLRESIERDRAEIRDERRRQATAELERKERRWHWALGIGALLLMALVSWRSWSRRARLQSDAST